MLDSLVRVSRRVGGATDLLGREMRTATERCSLYESSQLPVGRGARTPGAASRTDNFTQAVWSLSNGSCGKLQGKCSRDRASTSCQVIADQRQQGEQRPSLSSLQKLREPLRLPPHSFTYYLTLSSKFFSIFPHGTCLLSVSV